jgi:hypothetical protein
MQQGEKIKMLLQYRSNSTALLWCYLQFTKSGRPFIYTSDLAESHIASSQGRAYKILKNFERVGLLYQTRATEASINEWRASTQDGKLEMEQYLTLATNSLKKFHSIAVIIPPFVYANVLDKKGKTITISNEWCSKHKCKTCGKLLKEEERLWIVKLGLEG